MPVLFRHGVSLTDPFQDDAILPPRPIIMPAGPHALGPDFLLEWLPASRSRANRDGCARLENRQWTVNTITNERLTIYTFLNQKNLT